MPDTIHINDLLLTLDVQDLQEVILISLAIIHDISTAARLDGRIHLINYATVYATLVETLPKACYPSLEEFADHIFETLFRSHPNVHEGGIVTTLRDTVPRFVIETTRRRDPASPGLSKFSILGLGLIS